MVVVYNSGARRYDCDIHVLLLRKSFVMYASCYSAVVACRSSKLYFHYSYIYIHTYILTFTGCLELNTICLPKLMMSCGIDNLFCVLLKSHVYGYFRSRTAL